MELGGRIKEISGEEKKRLLEGIWKKENYPLRDIIRKIPKEKIAIVSFRKGEYSIIDFYHDEEVVYVAARKIANNRGLNELIYVMSGDSRIRYIAPNEELESRR